MILADLLNKIQPHVIGWIYNMISTGWISDSDTWVYVSATQLKIVGKDVRSRFPVGTKLRLTQGTVKYFYAIAAAMSGGDTLVTLTGGSDYALANAPITSPAYSYAACPPSFPQWFNYTPQNSGPAVIAGATGKFCITGRTCTIIITADNVSISGSAGLVNLSLPVDSAIAGYYLLSSYRYESGWLPCYNRLYKTYVAVNKGYAASGSSDWTGSESGVYIRIHGDYPI